jgi:hypothetical protein
MTVSASVRYKALMNDLLRGIVGAFDKHRASYYTEIVSAFYKCEVL